MEQKYFKGFYQKKVEEINKSIEKQCGDYALLGISNVINILGGIYSLNQALAKDVPHAVGGAVISLTGLGMFFYSRAQTFKQDRKIKEKFSELESTLFHEEDNIPFG